MKKLYFSVDSALLGEIGERLVEKSYVALAELVKNSYDADATLVKLEFIPEYEGPNKVKEIHISDNGSGMDIDTVQNYWMKIATTVKKHQNISPEFGRPRTGSKGIGRFACRRLGNYLRLETVAKVSKSKFQKTKMVFDWSKFKEGTDVKKIPVEAEIEDMKGLETGTKLIIKKLSEKWTQRDFNTMKRNIATLAANIPLKRKGFAEDTGFNIEIEAPSFEGGIGNLREQLKNSGWGTLEGKVKANGDVIYRLDAKNIGKKEYIKKNMGKNIPHISFRIGILPMVKEHMRDKKVASLKNLRKIINQWGGVYVRHNNFRVYPYGEQGNDWLEIDRDRGRRLAKPADEEIFSLSKKIEGVDSSRFLLNTLSSSQYFGHVDIYSDKTEGFTIKANREGFIYSEEVEQLKQFIRTGIHWATIYYNHYLYKRKIEELKKDISDFIEEDIKAEKVSLKEGTEKSLNILENSINLMKNYIPEDKTEEIGKPLNKAINSLRNISKINYDELSQMRIIASTNPLLFSFSHEVRLLINQLNTHSNELKQISLDLKNSQRKRIQDYIKDLKKTKERFNNLMDFIGILSSPREQVAGNLTLKPRIEEALRFLKLIIDYYKIDIDFSEIPENMQVGPIKESELFSILINTLTNSIKAILANGNKRKIKYEIKKDNEVIKLRILDTGIGLSEKYWEEVFTPLIVDPEDKLYSSLEIADEDVESLGKGTGLGLNITRQILREYGGDIYFIKPSKFWSTCIEIKFK